MSSSSPLLYTTICPALAISHGRWAFCPIDYWRERIGGRELERLAEAESEAPWGYSMVLPGEEFHATDSPTINRSRVRDPVKTMQKIQLGPLCTKVHIFMIFIFFYFRKFI